MAHNKYVEQDVCQEMTLTTCDENGGYSFETVTKITKRRDLKLLNNPQNLYSFNV